VWLVVGGMLMGLALIAEYSAFLVLAGALFVALASRGRLKIGGFSVFLLVALAVFSSNFYYNYISCWSSFSYTLLLPWSKDLVGASGLLVAASLILLALPPWALWFWFRCGAKYTGIYKTYPGILLRFLAIPYLFVFLGLSYFLDLGYLWALAVSAFLWGALRALPESALLSIFRFNLGASYLIAGLLALFAMNMFAPRVINGYGFYSQKQESADFCGQLPSGRIFFVDSKQYAKWSVECGLSDAGLVFDSSVSYRDVVLRSAISKDPPVDFYVLAPVDFDSEKINTHAMSVDPLGPPRFSEGMHLISVKNFDWETYKSGFIRGEILPAYGIPNWIAQPTGCPVVQPNSQ